MKDSTNSTPKASSASSATRRGNTRTASRNTEPAAPAALARAIRGINRNSLIPPTAIMTATSETLSSRTRPKPVSNSSLGLPRCFHASHAPLTSTHPTATSATMLNRGHSRAHTSPPAGVRCRCGVTASSASIAIPPTHAETASTCTWSMSPSATLSTVVLPSSVGTAVTDHATNAVPADTHANASTCARRRGTHRITSRSAATAHRPYCTGRLQAGRDRLTGLCRRGEVLPDSVG